MRNIFRNVAYNKIRGSGSVVERCLAKANVAGPNPVSRSTIWHHGQVVRHGSAKPLSPGSNPGGASKKESNLHRLLNFLSKPTKEAWYVINALARCMEPRRSRAWHHDAVVYIISPFRAVYHHALACILSSYVLFHFTKDKQPS